MPKRNYIFFNQDLKDKVLQEANNVSTKIRAHQIKNSLALNRTIKIEYDGLILFILCF